MAVVLYPVGLPIPQVERTHGAEPRGHRTTMDSGRQRHRRRFLEPFETVEATFRFTEDEYDSFLTWYEDKINNGADHFGIELKFFSTLKPWEAAFLDTRFSFNHSDNLFEVRAQLEISQDLTLAGFCQDPNLIEETWESYSDTEFISLVTLDQGCGWDGPWSIIEYPPYIVAFDTFADYDDTTDLESATFEEGGGWDGAWNFIEQPPKLIATETFETYSDTTDLEAANFNDGFGWNGAWNLIEHYPQITASETWEAYSDTNDLTNASFNGGTGWDGGWNFIDQS